jgi:hypothetical protein
MLFLLLIAGGGAGGLAGSIVGAAFGTRGLFAGGFIGGLLAAPCAAFLAAWLRWIEPAEAKSTALGAALGFAAAATIAVNTLSSLCGPVLSTLVIGAGGLAGRRFHSRDHRSRVLKNHVRS